MQLAVILLALDELPPLAQVFGFALRIGNGKNIPSLRDPGQPEHLDGYGGLGFLDALAMLVKQSAHPATVDSGNKRLADTQRALLHQDRGHGTPPLVEVGFDDCSSGFLVGVGL